MLLLLKEERKGSINSVHVRTTKTSTTRRTSVAVFVAVVVVAVVVVAAAAVVAAAVVVAVSLRWVFFLAVVVNMFPLFERLLCAAVLLLVSCPVFVLWLRPSLCFAGVSILGFLSLGLELIQFYSCVSCTKRLL